MFHGWFRQCDGSVRTAHARTGTVIDGYVLFLRGELESVAEVQNIEVLGR